MSDLFGDPMGEQITAEANDRYDPENDYPPEGTENACLIISLDCDRFEVLGHSGRYFHVQINCAGYNSEEIGIDDIPDQPGYWVMENGILGGEPDNLSMSGEWRPAAREDFTRFNVDLPACWQPAAAVIVHPFDGKVHMTAMCNRALRWRLQVSDELWKKQEDMDAHYPVGRFVIRDHDQDRQGMIAIKPLNGSQTECDRATEIAHIGTMYLNANDLAKVEGKRIEVYINVVGDKP